MHRISPARRVVGIVAAARAEVVVREVADRVQHDVREHDEQERQQLEPAIGCGQQASKQRRLERNDEDHAAG